MRLPYVLERAAVSARRLIGGGDEEDRTPDLRIANATLSQLSYVPTCFCSRSFYNELPSPDNLGAAESPAAAVSALLRISGL